MGAPSSPPKVTAEPTTPPPLIRERPAFLHPHVCFLEALSGETIEGVTETTVAGVKNQLANMTDVSPMQIVLLDRHHGAIVNETQHSFAAVVLVYIKEEARMPDFPLALLKW